MLYFCNRKTAIVFDIDEYSDFNVSYFIEGSWGLLLDQEYTSHPSALLGLYIYINYVKHICMYVCMYVWLWCFIRYFTHQIPYAVQLTTLSPKTSR